MRWTRRSIIEEIRYLHATGEELNYASAEENHINLVRASAWHYGTWKRAVEATGLNYDDVSKYRRWTKERVIARIRELYEQGADLSWRTISTEGDQALAAAAVRANIGFNTWHDAVTAAGINYEEVARYRHWTPERVVKEIQELARQKAPLSSKLVQQNHPPLYNAAKRRFKQWDLAIEAAGIDPEKVRQRRRLTPTQPHRRRLNEKGEYGFEHLNKADESKKRRRSPKKSLFPIAAKPLDELTAPPRVEPLPLQRRDKNTGRPRVSPKKVEVFEELSREMETRAKILTEAARKIGRQPEKNGHARRKELLEQQQLQLELENAAKPVVKKRAVKPKPATATVEQAAPTKPATTKPATTKRASAKPAAEAKKAPKRSPKNS